MRRFADAFEADGIGAIVALLAEDAWLTMPPATLEYQGPSAIGAFLGQAARWRGPHANRLAPTRANGQPAFACHLRDAHAPIAHASGLIVLTLRGDRIWVLTRFLDDSLLARFGLLRTLRESPSRRTLLGSRHRAVHNACGRSARAQRARPKPDQREE